MVKHIGLVIAEVTNWVISIMSILESACLEVRQSVQIENFLEISYSIVTYV